MLKLILDGIADTLDEVRSGETSWGEIMGFAVVIPLTIYLLLGVPVLLALSQGQQVYFSFFEPLVYIYNLFK